MPPQRRLQLRRYALVRGCLGLGSGLCCRSLAPGCRNLDRTSFSFCPPVVRIRACFVEVGKKTFDGYLLLDRGRFDRRRGRDQHRNTPVITASGLKLAASDPRPNGLRTDAQP